MDPLGPINLSRVQRCDQDWATMPPIPGGRLCQQCSKRIVDFTRMSPIAITQAHLASDTPVCGMYREEQLRSPRPRSHAPVGWRTHPARLSLVSLLFLEPSVSPAQDVPTEQVSPEPDVDDPSRKTRSEAANATEPVIIRGSVMEHGEPVPFVPVFVKGTALNTTTDINGRFAIDLTAVADTQQRVVLVMRYIGYTTSEQEVDLRVPAEVTFHVAERSISEIAYSVVYKRPPLHKRIWWGIQRPFRR